MAAPVIDALAKRTGLSRNGFLTRAGASTALALGVFLLPLALSGPQADLMTKAVVYAVIGLSLNVLLGHAGQISLGHQAFVGIGAFASGAMVSKGISFYLALPLAGLIGAASALILGVVALRLRGLYLALITLAYGALAEESLFNIRALTGGGAGQAAPRPSGFTSDRAYLYICLIVLALVLVIDWRLVKSKAGRAILAIRHDDRVAATMGINVTFYKIFAFVLSGFLAGIGGSLFGHWVETVVSVNFDFQTALIWVFMVVVGGLGSRAGVVVGSAFFALFSQLIRPILDLFMSHEGAELIASRLEPAIPLIGAILLVLTLTLYPGGIGQQLLPLRRWLAGGPFLEHHAKDGHGGDDAPPGADAQAASIESAVADETTEMAAVPDADATQEVPAAVGDGAAGARPRGLRRLTRARRKES